jgi:hypothetical protein
VTPVSTHAPIAIGSFTKQGDTHGPVWRSFTQVAETEDPPLNGLMASRITTKLSGTADVKETPPMDRRAT